jgi:cytochrome b involved in lipid metabolism
MKKTFIVFALALVLSVVVAPGSSASVKAGAACKKAGLTSITGGFKYTCLKKSGKLVWVKGVAVKASAKPSAKPSVSAKPSASATAAPASSTAPSVRPSATVAPSVAPASYTMAQVKANKSAAKCWSVINEKVYDLTAWINAHPGGDDAIISLCGTDGTQDFLAMHRNQSKPESRLSAFLLGPLAK